MSPALLLTLACTGPELQAPSGAPPVEVRATLAERAVEAGGSTTLSLRVTAAEGWSFAAGGPEGAQPGAESGLIVEPLPTETLGTRERETTVLAFRLAGEDGSYVIAPLEVRFTGPEGEEQIEQVGPFYLDIGVDGPASQLSGPVALAPSAPPRWPWAVGAAAALAVLGLAGVIWRRGQEAPVAAPPAPIPPHVRALAAWEAARADASLDEHGLALALSTLFRGYLEEVLLLPAMSMTSFELLDRLEHEDGFTAALHSQAKRLLSATDLIKFARQGGGEALFDALDADLRAVIDATAPRPAPESGDA